MSDEVINFKLAAAVTTVAVPATFTTPDHGRGGANDFSVEVGYLSNDINGRESSTAWATATEYDKGEVVAHGGHAWICTVGHTSGTDEDEPGIGAEFADWWGSYDPLFRRLWDAINQSDSSYVDGADISGTLPLTITPGSNDQFGYGGNEYIIEAGTYASIGALAVAIQAADADEDNLTAPTFSTLVHVSASPVTGCLRFTAQQKGTNATTFTTGVEHSGLTAIGLTTGWTIANTFAAANGRGYFYFEGTMRKDPVSAANPKWSGVAVVIEANIGAVAQDLSVGQTTFPMVGAPAQATS